MNQVWTATIKDDVSSVAAKMGGSLKTVDSMASKMFKAADGNMKEFRKSLKDVGVSTVDAEIVMSKYRRELVATRKDMLGLADAAGKTQSTLKSAIGEVSKGALRFVGEKLVSGVAGIAGLVADAGKGLVDSVLEAAQFRSNALSGLEYMLGSREAAVDIFKQAQELALKTPLDTDKVITGIKQLVTSGFSGKESTLLFKAVADQAAKFADDAGMQDKVIAAFSRVKGRGVATGEDLESFRVAGFRAEGIVQSLLENENLAPLFKKVKITGIGGAKSKWVDLKDADNESILKQVKEILGEGKVGSTTFLNAALKSLVRDKSVGLGGYAEEQGEKSLTGTISNFKSAFSDLLKSVDIQDWQGVKDFQGFLTRVTKALQGDTGKGLLKTIENIMNSLLGGLSKIKQSDIDGFVRTIASVGEHAVSVIKDAWDWLDRLMHAEPGAFLSSLKGVLIDIGKLIGQGLYAGFKEAATSSIVPEFLRNGGGGAVEETKALNTATRETKDELDSLAESLRSGKIEGKSAEYDRLRAQYEGVQSAEQKKRGNALADDLLSTPQGTTSILDIPEFAEGGIVNGRTLAWVGEAGPEAIVPLNTTAGYNASGIASLQSGTGRGIGSLTVNVVVQGGADAQATGGIIADVVVERIMMNYFERTAQEG